MRVSFAFWVNLSGFDSSVWMTLSMTRAADRQQHSEGFEIVFVTECGFCARSSALTWISKHNHSRECISKDNTGVWWQIDLCQAVLQFVFCVVLPKSIHWARITTCVKTNQCPTVELDFWRKIAVFPPPPPGKEHSRTGKNIESGTNGAVQICTTVSWNLELWGRD